VNRRPLRSAYLGATLAVLAAVLSPQPAAAHLNVQPRLIERETVTDLVVELPRLRPGAPPERLDLEAPGLDVLTSRLREVIGGETRWDVRARADAPPGTLALVLRAGFADGRTVEVDDTLIVVPAEPSDPFPLVAAIVGAGLAVGFAAAALLLARRKP
jgi:hypothetical protein